MADLIFPQLSSGAMVQYPIRKRTDIRTVKNLLADGTMFTAADPGASRLFWTLTYLDLPLLDLEALRSHFVACRGPFRAFTFLDPTDNLLTYSADLTQSCWLTPAGLLVQAGIADPKGGTGAFSVTNASAATLHISQTLAAPANFQYCFSVYAASAGPAMCGLTRSSANAEQTDAAQIGPIWSRISSSGVLNDAGLGISVGISIAPAQTLTLFGPQLEPQFEPSRFRPTYSNAGLYPNAHWADAELIFTAEGPDLFSTSFNVEAGFRD